jgi:hypothetical protein
MKTKATFYFRPDRMVIGQIRKIYQTHPGYDEVEYSKPREQKG